MSGKIAFACESLYTCMA